MFSLGSDQSIGSLRTENEILSTTLYSEGKHIDHALQNGDTSDHTSHPQEVLAVVNKDGILEIFPAPFTFGDSTSKDLESLKSRRKQMTRKATAQIRVTRPDKSAPVVPLIDAEFYGNDIVMAWVEGGVNPIFDRLQWRNEKHGDLMFTGLKEVVKAKSGAGLGAVVMNGVKDMGKSYADESRAVVAKGGDVEDLPTTSGNREIIDISSGVEESDSDEEMVPEPAAADEKSDDVDVEMKDAKSVDDDDEATGAGQELERMEEHEEPSFGDMMRANAPEPVDVQATFEDLNAQALAPVGERQLSLPPGMTLTTVLTQSLRTNDVNLLETCFHERNLDTVRATIERLDSSLAITLIQKLAERLYSRPGRAGRMMVWIQWTAVAHGGYIASQPEVIKKLAELRRVVDDRANSLQALLKLKGKLDMLEAQTNLRKSMQAMSRMASSADDDDEEAVIYVEGQEESDSEDEEAIKISTAAKPNGKVADLQEREDTDQSESEEEDNEEGEILNMANGVVHDSEAESSESEEVESLDNEASSADQDSDDEASEDGDTHDTVDSADSDASSEPAGAPPVKRSKKERHNDKLSVEKRSSRI